MQLNKQSTWGVGKRVGNKRYLHVDTLPEPADEPDAAALLASLTTAEEIAQVRRAEHFNLVRVDLAAGSVGFRTYADSLNPPILHRKELLLAADDPRYDAWAELTAACESVGLFDDPRRIGYRRQWAQLVRERGYRLVDHALVPIGNEDETDDGADDDAAAEQGPSSGALSEPDSWSAARHRTAPPPLPRATPRTPICSRSTSVAAS